MNKANAMRRARVNLHGVALLPFLLAVVSCDNATGPDRDRLPLLIVSGNMEAQFQNFRITREGAAVTDATVTVNGVAIPHTGGGVYQGQLPTAVPAGSPLNLQVSGAGSTVQGTVMVPEAPVLTAPATGALFDPGDTITVNWTSATNPDRFVVSVAGVFGSVASEKTVPAAGSARELEIVGILLWLWLPMDSDITISVVAYNDGSFTGQAADASRVSIRALGSPSPVIRIN